ncbi:MAG: S8 family serine peptidase, partial [Planctomycetaceae bacterium]
MKLRNWLSELVERTARRAGRSRRLPSDVGRTANRLESRICLSSLTSYSAASVNWFGQVESSPSTATVSPEPGGTSTATDSNSDITRHQFLVRLTAEATAAASSLSGAQDFLADGTVDLQVIAGLGLPGQILISTSEQDSAQVVQSLQANSAVAYFEEDFSVGASAFPNEKDDSPQFPRQYALNNTGQTDGVANADIDAPEAWDITVGGATTVVAVIDSGVDYTHEDLYLNIWINQGELPALFANSLAHTDADQLITFRDLNDAANVSFVTDLNLNGYIDAGDLLEDPRWADGIDNDNNGFEDDLVGWDFLENDNKPFDEHRHGTHVAGIIGAIGASGDETGYGVVGVNWQTSMMPLRFLDQDNKGDISNAVKAINYTSMMRTRDEHAANIRVSNNSWGSSGAFTQGLFDAVAGNDQAGILFVAAAGNGDAFGQGSDNGDVAYFPANLELPNVISVAALNDRGELAGFSNFGSLVVDIAAPGVDIISTEAAGDFISRSGTSMAAPHVAGVAALVFDQFPEATAAEVRDAILVGATELPVLDGLINDSRSLNAWGALTASTFAPVPALVPVADLTTTSTEVVITVTYTDDGTVDTNSFDIRDVEITRLGFSETLLTPASATTTKVNVDGQNRDAAVYRFTAPGGTWDATENGTWIVSLREGEIRDDQGLYSAPRSLGPFEVAIEDESVIFVTTTLDTIDPVVLDGRISLRSAIMQANRAEASTFRNDTELSIPTTGTSGTIESTLNIANSGIIDDINVVIEIEHTFDADLDVVLVSPAGTEVELFSDVGGSGNNFLETTFDDDASIAITAGSPPFSGQYRPEQALSTFNGESVTGTWKLRVTDDAGGDSGTLKSWSLIIAEPPTSAATIVIPDGIYVLTIAGTDENAAHVGDLDLNSSVGITLLGSGSATTVIDAQQLDRAIDIRIGAVATISGLTLRNGNADIGGGVSNSGTLTIDTSVITDNTAEIDGGGVFNDGTLTITNSSLENNLVTSRFFGFGGGLATAGTGHAILDSVSVIRNVAGVSGGGISAKLAGLSISNSTISGNVAVSGNGGGIAITGVPGPNAVTIKNSTIVENYADRGAGGGVASDLTTPRISVSNSIVANNSSNTSRDLSAKIVSNGNNVFGQPDETQADWREFDADGNTDFDRIGTAQFPFDPQLSPLRRTSTHLSLHTPLTGSPVIDAGTGRGPDALGF